LLQGGLLRQVIFWFYFR